MPAKVAKEFNVDIINGRKFSLSQVQETVEALMAPPEVKRILRLMARRGEDVETKVPAAVATWVRRTFRIAESGGRARLMLRKSPSVLVLKISVPPEFDQTGLVLNMLIYALTFLRMRKTDLFDEFNAALADASGQEFEDVEDAAQAE